MFQQIIHADCFTYASQLAENSLSGIVTDPPFGVVEFTESETEKLRSRKGGIWRLPPKIGGSTRNPLPRFTTLSPTEKQNVRKYFKTFGEDFFHALKPGAHLLIAGTPTLQYLVQDGFAAAGYDVRGAIMRLYQGFRGGDRPKGAEREFPNLSVSPRGNYEPWMLFRKPISERTVAANLKRWGTGALRRPTTDKPVMDIIPSERTPQAERIIGDHPTMKSQKLMRELVSIMLPRLEGIILDPFAGSGSTLAACKYLGIDYLGIEKDTEYFSRLEKNIESLAKIQTSLHTEHLKLF